MQGIGKKFKNWEENWGEFVAKKLIKRDKQELKNCLCNNRWIPQPWVKLMAQIRELQNKVTSSSDARKFLRSWTREQLWSDPRSRSNFNYSTSQNLAALRFWIAAWYTEWYGYYRKRFWTTTCSRRTVFYDIKQFKEFGNIFSGIEIWYYRNSKAREKWK